MSLKARLLRLEATESWEPETDALHRYFDIWERAVKVDDAIAWTVFFGCGLQRCIAGAASWETPLPDEKRQRFEAWVERFETETGLTLEAARAIMCQNGTIRQILDALRRRAQQVGRGV